MWKWLRDKGNFQHESYFKLFCENSLGVLRVLRALRGGGGFTTKSAKGTKGGGADHLVLETGGWDADALCDKGDLRLNLELGHASM